MVDETPITIPDHALPKNKWTGFYWVYFDPVNKRVFSTTKRLGAVLTPTLQNFSGFLQSDGYAGYQEVAAHHDIVPLACLAHAHGKFVEAKAAGGMDAGKIQRLYQIESQARERVDDIGTAGMVPKTCMKNVISRIAEHSNKNISQL